MTITPFAVSDPTFWKERLQETPPDCLHYAVFKCPRDRWLRIEAKHKDILERVIGPKDRVLDAGCAWGRLIDLLPGSWNGEYTGVDISPDFLAMAKERNPGFTFEQQDLRHLPRAWSNSPFSFDWAVMISIRPMIKRHLGDQEWSLMEKELRRVAKRLLYLEYDEHDEGSVE